MNYFLESHPTLASEVFFSEAMQLDLFFFQILNTNVLIELLRFVT